MFLRPSQGQLSLFGFRLCAQQILKQGRLPKVGLALLVSIARYDAIPFGGKTLDSERNG